MRARLISFAGVIAAGAAAWHCGGTTLGSGGPDASSDATNDSSSGDAGSGSDAGHDAGGDSAVACNPACGMGRQCCNGVCVNVDNDPANCGTCGTHCSGNTPFCDGTCKPTPCGLEGGACSGGGACCGVECCTGNQICCKTEGPQVGAPTCYTPTSTAPSCPQGCAPQCVSDVNAKRDIVPVEGQRVLDALARVPMSTWAYKDDPTRRHLGPMAQDLHAAGLSGSDTSYDPVDAHGIAFTSIQALYAMIKEQNARIERLEKENARLQSGVCK